MEFWEGVLKQLAYRDLSQPPFVAASAPHALSVVAAMAGQLGCLEFLHKQKVPLPAGLIDVVVGHKAATHLRGDECEAGRHACVLYLLKQGLVMSPSVVAIANRRGFHKAARLAVLEKLKGHVRCVGKCASVLLSLYREKANLCLSKKRVRFADDSDIEPAFKISCC